MCNISFLLRQSLLKRVSILRYTYIASVKNECELDGVQEPGALQANRKYEHSEKSATSIIRREETTVHI
jgi:hypothetical protein